MFNYLEVCAMIDLIEFHDDWNEVSERLDVNVEKLYDKLTDMLETMGGVV